MSKKQKDEEEFEIWNGIKFYYIAGYTSGGAPYGITWEEYQNEIKDKENNEEKDNKDKKPKKEKEKTFSDGDIPF
jgi:hypothetical protein